MSLRNIESTTWFDSLPTEIIFMIFGYLSNNDIIHSFFYFNLRLNDLLLQNLYDLKLTLPTTDLNTWERNLSIVGSQIQSLNINTPYLSIPLTYFSNLKSLVISSPYGLSNKEMKLILKSDQFKHLHSFKLKQSQLLFVESPNTYSTNEEYILNKVFCTENSLKIFEYSMIIPSFTEINKINFITNSNLHSLTVILFEFNDIFSLIKYIPNLKYLNLHSNAPYHYENRINKSDIKLEQLYIKLSYIQPRYAGFATNDYDQLINDIQHFSLSLNCLSLDLVDLTIRTDNKFPFNNIKLQQLLESMTELKQFYLYAKLNRDPINRDEILSKFKDQFWFDHNYSFGMHGQYFYTLPFHFDYLHKFYGGFNDVKTNHFDILNHPRLWYYV